jgi:hypothetical protein
MAAVSCPYCGATLNLPLKFCLSCGRPVSSQEAKKLGGLKSTMKAGVTKRLDETPSPSNFDLARKSYRIQRTLREFATTLCYILLLVSLYYFAVKFILKQALPGNADVVIRNWLTGQQEPPPPAPAAQEPAGAAAGEALESSERHPDELPQKSKASSKAATKSRARPSGRPARQ